MKIKKYLYASTALTLAILAPFTVAFASELASKVAQSSTSLDVRSSDSVLHDLRDLEKRREQAIFNDYSALKELTAEISSCIMKICTEVTLPSGQSLDLLVNSVIQTRQTFPGQPCLGKGGMINRYIPNFDSNDGLTEIPQLASIMAIDALAQTALDNEDFADLWLQQSADTEVSEAFVDSVIKNMTAHGWSAKTVASFTGAVRNVLIQNPKLIRLSGDIFDLCAPKLNLFKVYDQLAISGGNYKGWEIDGLSSWSYVVTLTLDEKQQYLNRENEIRVAFVKDIFDNPESYPLYSTSSRGVKTSESDITKAVIAYYYNPTLRARGHDVDGMPLPLLVFKRTVPSELEHLLLNSDSIISNDHMSEIYNLSFACLSLNVTNEKLAEGHAKGLWQALRIEAKNNPVRDSLRAIELYKEALDVHPNKIHPLDPNKKSFSYEAIQSELAVILNKYAVDFGNGTNGVVRDLPRAIEIFKEALDVHPDKTENSYETMQINLSNILNEYAKELRNVVNGIAPDLPRAIELFKEALDVNPDKTSALYKTIQKKLAGTLNTYATDLFNRTNGSTRDLLRAAIICKESIDIYPNKTDISYKNIQITLSTILNEYANNVRNGTNGIVRNLPRAIEFFKEVLDVHPDKTSAPYKKLKINLSTILNEYANDLRNGTNGIVRNLPRAIEFFKEVLDVHPEKTSAHYKKLKINLSTILNECANDLRNGTNGIVRNLPGAIELFKEALDVHPDKTSESYKIIQNNLAISLNAYAGHHLFHGPNGCTRDLPRAIELFKEALDVHPDKTEEFYKEMQSNLVLYLNTYAGHHLFYGPNGCTRDLPRAIELFKEALDVHPDKTEESYKGMQSNLANTLNTYAGHLFHKTNGCTRDLPRAIELFKEALDVHPDKTSENYKNIQISLSTILNEYANDFRNGTNDVVRDLLRAIELFKEALDMVPDKTKEFYKKLQSNLENTLITYALECCNGTNDVYITRNFPRAIDLFKEVLNVHPDKTSESYKKIQSKLATTLHGYATDLFLQMNDIIRDYPRAIKLFKEGLYLYPDKTNSYYKVIQNSLSYMINKYADAFRNGTNGVVRDFPRAIELFKEALDAHPDKTSESYKKIQSNLTATLQRQFMQEDEAEARGAAAQRDAMDIEQGKNLNMPTTSESAFRYDAKDFGDPIPALKRKLGSISFPSDSSFQGSGSLMIEYIPGSQKGYHVSSYGYVSEFWQLVAHKDGAKKILGRAFSCLDAYGQMSNSVVCFKEYPDFHKKEPIFIDLSDSTSPKIIQGPEEITGTNLWSKASLYKMRP
ncbi:MAG: hypothetical protein V4544_03080 [Pseudomonadota bacterium]